MADNVMKLRNSELSSPFKKSILQQDTDDLLDDEGAVPSNFVHADLVELLRSSPKTSNESNGGSQKLYGVAFARNKLLRPLRSQRSVSHALSHQKDPLRLNGANELPIEKQPPQIVALLRGKNANKVNEHENVKVDSPLLHTLQEVDDVETGDEADEEEVPLEATVGTAAKRGGTGTTVSERNMEIPTVRRQPQGQPLPRPLITSPNQHSELPFDDDDEESSSDKVAEREGFEKKFKSRLDSVRRTLSPYLPTYGSLQTPSMTASRHEGGSDCQIRMHSVASGRCLGVVQGHTSVIYSLTIAHDKHLLLSCSKDRTVRVWRIARLLATEDISLYQEAVLSGHKSWVFDVCVLKSGKHAVSASKDSTLIVWCLKTFTYVHTFNGHTKQVFCVVPFKNDSVLSTGWDGSLRCWDVREKKEVSRCTQSSLPMVSLSVSPDGSRAVTSTVGGQIMVWRLDCFELEAVLDGHEDTVLGTSFIHGGKTIVTGSLDGTIKHWQAQTMQTERTILHGGFRIHSLATSPDGAIAVAGCSDGQVRYWKVRDTETVISLKGHTDDITAICGTQDGIRCITASRDKILRVWRFEEPHHVLEAEIGRHKDEVIFLQMAQDGSTLVSGSSDGTVKTWRIDTLELAKEIVPSEIDVKPMQCACLSLDGRFLFGAAKERTTLYIYDTKLGTFWERDVLPSPCANMECLPATWSNEMPFQSPFSKLSFPRMSTSNEAVKGIRHHIQAFSNAVECRVFVCGFLDGSIRFYAHSPLLNESVISHAPASNSESYLSSLEEHGSVTCIHSSVADAEAWSRAIRNAVSGEQKYFICVGFENGTVVMFNCYCHVIFQSSEEGGENQSRLRSVVLNVRMEPINAVKGHEKAVRDLSLHVNPEFVSLLSFGDDHTMRLWDVAAGQDADEDGFDDIIEALCLPTDKGHILTIQIDRTVRFLRELWPCTVASIIVPNSGERVVKLLPFDLSKDLRDKIFTMRNIWTDNFSILHSLFERCFDLDNRRSALELFEAILSTDQSWDPEDASLSSQRYFGVQEPLVLPFIPPHGTVLDWAAETQDRDVTRMLLARLSRDAQRSRLLGNQDRIALAPALRHLFCEMPDVAEEFVDTLGLEEAESIVLGSKRRVPVHLSWFAVDCPSKMPVGLWENVSGLTHRKKETSEMPARPFLVPLPILEPGMLEALVEGAHLPLFKTDAIQTFISWQWWVTNFATPSI